MHLAQFAVSTAFLYEELEEIIYMRQPEGYDDSSSRVCQLKKSLYGLKQAPRCWNKRFGNFFSKLGFKVSEADPCLYIRERDGKKLILVVYVDDGLIGATDSQDLEVFLKELKSEFKIISKKAEYFLGLEIKQEENNVKISQQAYARRILERFNFLNCKPISTLMLKSSEISRTGKDDAKEHKFPYRQAVGSLMYLMLGTRPDLAYSVGFLSRSLENPSAEDIVRVKRMFRYIAGTIDLGIVYCHKSNKGILECFSDADFGGCTKTGRSTSGVVVTYAGGAISWLSQRQAMVATSTTKAEIVAANAAAKEVIWLSKLFEGIAKLKQIPVLQVDNSAAVRLAQNLEFYRRNILRSNTFLFERR
ncbi:integrase core domain protein [Lasius niger]|uniref:Integrase core domain protein n=1 Tax=Lasius niger TaxID=67767 RepID=A0A0J7JZ17_LASNI|nr:integrase core domain protein [Lasius niger]